MEYPLLSNPLEKYFSSGGRPGVGSFDSRNIAAKTFERLIRPSRNKGPTRGIIFVFENTDVVRLFMPVIAGNTPVASVDLSVTMRLLVHVLALVNPASVTNSPLLGLVDLRPSDVTTTGTCSAATLLMRSMQSSNGSGI